MQDNTTEALTRSFISLRLKEYVEGFLSHVQKLNRTLNSEIDRYLMDYEPLNPLEYE